MTADRPSRRPEEVDDAETRARFDEYTPMADRLARRYSFGYATDDDLRQVAHIGLLLASRRFDPEIGEFKRYASVTIVGELKKHLRSSGWAVRVPRSLQEDSITVASATDRLTSSIGRSPTVGEVAEATGFERERVANAMRARDARFSRSTDATSMEFEHSDDEATTALVQVALDSLPPDQRELIHYRLNEDLTQAEIGRLIGISQPQVHRRLSAAIDALRERLREVEP